MGLSIFCLSKEALTSGSSISKSNEYFCYKYNGINICIDDIKGTTLTSDNFAALIKSTYKGKPRKRMRHYGKEVEYIHNCGPLAYSTNDPLPDLREVVNRLNIIEIFGNVFKADKFNYHELHRDNLNELSLILPEILNYPEMRVVDLYEKLFKILKKI